MKCLRIFILKVVNQEKYLLAFKMVHGRKFLFLNFFFFIMIFLGIVTNSTTILFKKCVIMFMPMFHELRLELLLTEYGALFILM